MNIHLFSKFMRPFQLHEKKNVESTLVHLLVFLGVNFIHI